ncbi:MAG: TIGR02300 family protein [Alphaproteobacteria bacterium]
MKPEWGIRRICQSCSAPFYDLRRSPIVCPKCESVFDPESVLKSRRKGPPSDAAEKKKKDAVAEVAEKSASGEEEKEKDPEALGLEDTEAVKDDADSDAVPEDASDLADDDEVVEAIEGGKKAEET